METALPHESCISLVEIDELVYVDAVYAASWCHDLHKPKRQVL
jgi:hypothetical protein